MSHQHVTRLDDNIEKKVEKECELILKTDNEFWEIRNTSMLKLIAIVTSLQGTEADHVQEVFSLNIFRLLKDPIKQMVADLRSQQVRDTCLFLSKLSEVCGDHMKHLLRDIFPAVLDGVKVPNRVMSGFVDTCILKIIKHTTFKSCLQLLFNEIKESKAKFVRERCIEYINEILITWDISDKEYDLLADAIRVGLEDASVKAREIARLAYLNMFQRMPQKTEKIKTNLSVQLRTRLAAAEVNHTSKLAKINGTVGPILEIIENEVKIKSIEVISEPLTLQVPVLSGDVPIDPVLAASFSEFSSEKDKNGSTTPNNRILTLRIRRQSCEAEAVTSIQAIIRGKLSRRQSINSSVIALDEVGSPSDPSVRTIHDNTSNVEGNESNTGATTLVEEATEVAPCSPPRGQPSSSSSVNATPTRLPTRASIDGSPFPSGATDDTNPTHLTIGLVVAIKAKEDSMGGIVRFIGKTTFASGFWVGIELTRGSGKNNGSVNDVQYFKCSADRGIFLRPSQVVVDQVRSQGRIAAEALKRRLAETMEAVDAQLILLETAEAAGGVDDAKQFWKDVVAIAEHEMRSAQTFLASIEDAFIQG